MLHKFIQTVEHRNLFKVGAFGINFLCSSVTCVLDTMVTVLLVKPINSINAYFTLLVVNDNENRINL